MVSQKPAKLSCLSWVVWVRIPVSAPYAVCPGGAGAALKSVGCKRLAGSNPVHGAVACESLHVALLFLLISQYLFI